MSRGRLTDTEMNERLGFGLGFSLLWSAAIKDKLGVAPAGHGPHGYEWTEEQFIEICRRLRDHLDKTITFYTDDEL